MAVAIFFVLALLVAGWIAYPLLTERAYVQQAPIPVNDAGDQATRRRRSPPARNASGADVAPRQGALLGQNGERGLACPSCGQGYSVGDFFCVRCGQALPASREATTAQGALSTGACSSCGAVLRQDDQFCAKCGAPVVRTSSDLRTEAREDA